jgi:hypothetical protein
MMMKTLMKTFAALVAAMIPVLTSAQKNEDPHGALTYCLPSTTVSLEVTAVQEHFHAGPYAKYAEKYLGVKAPVADYSVCRITEIKMTPYIEADQNARYTLMTLNGKVDASFLKLSSAGLVSMTDAVIDRETSWRFPGSSKGDFSSKGVTSNLTSEAAVLYKSDKKDAAFSRVSVQQSVTVAKTPEQKAAETAEMIVNLRKQRLQIVTGDTDATYSGEAMGAAIEELTRLEKEYMTLFLGYTESQIQKMNFDVIPQSGRENQKYIAFRISDTSGLVPADNLSGKPVLIEFIPQDVAPVNVEVSQKDAKKIPSVQVYYRIPSVCTVKITEGTAQLLQSRIPVYQLGVISSIPVNVILK